MVASLQQVIRDCQANNSVSRSKLWTKFHDYRQHGAVDVWEEISDLLVIKIDPILSQSTMEHLLVKLVKEGSSHIVMQKSRRELSMMEQRAVMYCRGYVVNRLLKRYRKDHSRVARTFVQVLLSLCSEEGCGEESESFDQYIKQWIKDIDRGGLKILHK